MGQIETMFEQIRIIIPSVIAAFFWIYLYFIRHDLKSTQEILNDRLWTNQPGEDKETILKGMIEAKKRQAKTATIIAVWFSVLAFIFAVFF